MRTPRTLLVLLALPVVLGLPGTAAAHPGSLDARGGHYCRPEGGGAFDCTRYGVEPGRYHCEQDPCRQAILAQAEDWCLYGIPYPTASDLTGLYPEQAFVPPIRVERLGGAGHILVVDRDLEPLVSPPSACVASERALELELPSGVVSLHVAADGGAPPHGAADPVTGPRASTQAAATGFEPLSPVTAPGRQAAVGLLGLAGVLVLRRVDRSRACWETASRDA